MENLPVDVLWIARYDYRRGWRLRPHKHDFWQMILFLDGKGVFSAGDRSFRLRGGELFLIQAGETHGLRAESLVRTLDVKFQVAPGKLARLLQRGAPVQEWNDPGIAARFERIRVEGEQKALCYREMCSVLLTEILFLYLREVPPNARPGASPTDAGTTARDPVVQRAVAWIRAHYHRPLTIREIARAVGCTDRTLRLHFHDALRTRPLTFLQHYRIQQSKALIQYSSYSLKEIAEQVGFQTVHHFTRLFTAGEGSSPAAWRRAYLEGVRKDVYISPDFENRSFIVRDEEELAG